MYDFQNSGNASQGILDNTVLQKVEYKAVGMKLYHVKNHSGVNQATLYKSQIQPLFEYWSNIWGTATR